MTPGNLRDIPSGVFDPVLDRLTAEGARLFDDADMRLDAVAYQERPFSYVLRVRVRRSRADASGPHLFIKVFKDKALDGGRQMRSRVAQDFVTTRTIHEFMSRWDDLGTVRPVACYDDLLALVTEETEGRTLLHYVEAEGRWFPSREALGNLTSTMDTVGRWLRAFHGFDDRRSQVAVADLRRYVDLRLERLVASGQIISAVDRQRVLDHLDALGLDIPPADLREVVIHADMAPANILVSGRRVVVLDFAMASRGSYLHDISRLFLQLDLLRAKPQFRPRVVEALQTALLRGLDPSLTPVHPLFRFLSMLHRINHLGTLSLGKERFPASLFSSRVRYLHRQWIESELESGPRQVKPR